MRDLDRCTIDRMGLPGMVLMENAGREAARALLERFPEAKKAVVLAGSGNNGGDGFVIARHLAAAGWEVSIGHLGQVEKMSPETQTFYGVCRQMGIPIVGKNESEKWIGTADVVVDALLGTGVRGELREPVRTLIHQVNRTCQGFVLAVDIPSGVDTDTGAVLGEAIRADLTVTFAAAKWCHYLRPAAEYRGELKVVDIGIPPAVVTENPPRAQLNQPSLWEKHLSPRSPWSHKGSHGHLLVLGGSQGMLGAAALSGMAALRFGVGMTTLGVPHGQVGPLAAKVTEPLIWGWPDGPEGGFSGAFPPDWEERAPRFTAVAVGPGLGRFTREKTWLERLLREVSVPVVLDADGLNILSGDLSFLEQRQGPTVLTPHPGEMARLLGISVEEVESSRHQVAVDVAERYGVTTVLKGTFTVIAFPDGQQVIHPESSPALAKAGSGDVLTGILGGGLARGIPVESAVSLGVYLHSSAGRLATVASAHSVLASDVIHHLGRAIHQIH